MSTPNTGNLPPDHWNSGEAYEQYVGRWSRMVGADFLKWLAPSESADWLDIGCGTGTLSRLILSDCKPKSVIGVDPSDGFIAFAAADIRDARASFHSGDARAIPVQSTSVDYTVAGLVINFVPDDDQMQAMTELIRATRSGGTVAAYVWDYLGEMQMMRHFWDAAIELDPSVAQRDEGSRFPLCQPGPLADLFSSSGLVEVEVRAIDVPTVFTSFDDYWSPFLTGVAPAPGYAMSLTEDDRGQLREAIRERLPIQPDGSIPLIARAWAVRGLKPSHLLS